MATKRDVPDLLARACDAGDLGEVRRLAGAHGLRLDWESRAAGAIRDCAARACAGGHLALTQWLVRAHRDAVPGSAVRSFLPCACRGGHLAVAAWIADHFEVGPDDAGRALLAASRFGRLEVVRWLCSCERLAPAVEAAGAALCFEPLRAACAGGHLAVAQWLADRFDDGGGPGLVAGAVRGRAVLAEAAGAGRAAVVAWLRPRFGLTADDARAGRGLALRGACARGDLAVAQMLVEEYGLGARDAQWPAGAADPGGPGLAACPLDLAARGRHHAVAAYLHMLIAAAGAEES